MKQEMKYNWDFIKVVLQMNNKNQHPYISSDDLKKFEWKMKKSLRYSKLKRILKN